MDKIRNVSAADVTTIRDIYSYYVTDTPITFEVEVPTIKEMENRIATYSALFPWIVLESEGKVVGYAYATTFKARAAYRWSVESSIYLHRDFRGKGAGTRLYSELIERLKKMGVRNIIGGLTVPNEASKNLHEKLGFIYLGKFPEVGFKQGQWWDVGYWQLTLPKPETPEELRKNNY